MMREHDTPYGGLRNQPQLITYVDRLAGDLAGLDEILRGDLSGAFGGVHLLPFFDPIDGADAGFDPVDHMTVDTRLGGWSDVARIASDFDVVADLIVNHISAGSAEFADWCERGVASPYDGMFLTYDGVYPGGASEDELGAIYRPRPGLPFTSYTVAGEECRVWTTFTAEQIDIDVDHPAAWEYLLGVLDRFAAANVKLVRLDAVGYAVKKPGTSSFMLPETFQFIARLGDECRRRGMGVLVEIHSHFRTQIEIAAQVDFVYDFALPPLVLHAIHAAPDGEVPGLLAPSQLDRLVESIHAASEGRSRLATGAAASNLDLYQVNCTFFEALASDDTVQLLARLIQVLVPGIPQVYYAGLLAAPNQMTLLERTGAGRDINRPYYSRASLSDQLDRSIVADTLRLLRWRTAEAELFGGRFELVPSDGHCLAVRWSSDGRVLDARLDLARREFELVLDGRTATTVAELDIPDVGAGTSNDAAV
jgi:sucrose phosphorylase